MGQVPHIDNTFGSFIVASRLYQLTHAYLSRFGALLLSTVVGAA